MEVKIRKLYENSKVPTRGSMAAAGYDLYAIVNNQDGFIEIKPHTNEKIGTGIAIEIPEGYFGAIAARSGLARKENLRPSNCLGIVDADYRGEVMVALHNDSNTSRFITPDERIAQLIILPFMDIDFVEVEELSDTDRGAGGFGHTGK